MPRRAYKKPYRAKKKKSLLAKASFWRSLCGFGVAGGAVWLVCFCPALEVKEISVEGAQKINQDDCAGLIRAEISKKIAFFDSKSILLFNMDQAKKEILAKFPQVEDIKIVRQFPSTIYASVEERRGVAIFLDGMGRRYSVDIQGIAFEEAIDPGEVIEISDAGTQSVQAGLQALDKELLSAILRMKGSIDGTGHVKVLSAAIATPERVNLLTTEGWYIFFNPFKDIEEQLVKLEAVLLDESFNAKRANLDYLDIRFKRVYLKEKSAAEGDVLESSIAPSEENGTILGTDGAVSVSQIPSE